MKQPEALMFASAITAGCEAVLKAGESLDQLDAVVGDGEHGTNMGKCLRSVEEKLCAGTYTTITEEVKAIGQTLLAAGGGTASTLMGMMFTYAAMYMQNTPDASPAQVVRFAYDSVKKRSQAEVGDKTMIDALEPAVCAFEREMAKNAPIKKALEEAAAAAQRGAQSTAGMIARRGRGLYAGERGKDVMDPGAVSVSLMVKAMSDRWEA